MEENEPLEPIRICPDCGKNAVLWQKWYLSTPCREWGCMCGWSKLDCDEYIEQEGSEFRKMDEKFFQWCWDKANPSK